MCKCVTSSMILLHCSQSSQATWSAMTSSMALMTSLARGSHTQLPRSSNKGAETLNMFNCLTSTAWILLVPGYIFKLLLYSTYYLLRIIVKPVCYVKCKLYVQVKVLQKRLKRQKIKNKKVYLILGEKLKTQHWKYCLLKFWNWHCINLCKQR